MRIARVQYKNETFHGVVEDSVVKRIEGDILSQYQISENLYPLEDVKLLAPIIPPNIIAIGLNYRKHAMESGSDIPERPVIFIKTTNSLSGPDDNIILPKIAPNEVDYEAELMIVIGKEARDIDEVDVPDYILGYTCSNDVSARDCQLRLDAQWARGKSFDTFCPIGPWIETELDPDNRPIRTKLNGNIVQDSNTSDLIFSIREIVSYCSKNMTLLPGTVIMTGTPEGVGFARKPPLFLKDGDVVEIEIEGIGKLVNGVHKE